MAYNRKAYENGQCGGAEKRNIVASGDSIEAAAKLAKMAAIIRRLAKMLENNGVKICRKAMAAVSAVTESGNETIAISAYNGIRKKCQYLAAYWLWRNQYNAMAYQLASMAARNGVIAALMQHLWLA